MRNAGTLLIIGLAIIALLGCATGSLAQDESKHNTNSRTSDATYFGLQPPGATAEAFAPEILTYEPHDSPVISADETWFILKGMEVDVLFYKMIDGQLALTDNPLDFAVPDVCNGISVSPSWNRIYIREWKDNTGHLYRIDRNGDAWTTPRYMELESFNRTWGFSLAANENLYYATDRIMVSVFDGDTHRDPTALKLHDGSDMLGGSPFVSPDESYIIYSIDGDLHISYKTKNGTWTSPVDLGPGINSDQLELCPQITPNGKYLLFNSRRNFPDWTIYWADASFIEELRPKTLK